MSAFVALPAKDTAAQTPQADVHEREPALPFRSDTILGVCEAVGQDLGIKPLFLRLAFAGLFYFNPPMVIGSYLALGAGVALARWLYPVRASVSEQAAANPAAPAADNEDSERSLAA